MFSFLTRRGCLVNLIVIALLFAAICYGILSALGYITQHGKYAKVPDVAGMTVAEATSLLERQGFRVEIQDSVWMADMKTGAVVRQSPDAKATVKAHRRIYLTVNRVQPPLVEMPNLVGFTFRNASIFLKQLGLELGDTIRKPDIAKDAVLEQFFNGRAVAPGTKVFVGSRISFVLGSGISQQEIEVPDMFGLKYSEALSALSAAGLNVGAVIPDFDVKDTLNAYVYKQNPEKRKRLDDGAIMTNRIRVGQGIDLFLSLAVPQARADDQLSADSTDAKEPAEEQ